MVAWIPTLVWLGIIAIESTASLAGGRTMIWLYRLSSFFSNHVTWSQIYYLNFALRKTGHFLGYATLSWFAFRGWMETLAYQQAQRLKKKGRIEGVQRRWHLRAAILAVLVTLAVAALDELHQARLPGRTGAVRDVVLDTMGGLFAQILLLLYWTRNKRVSPRGRSEVPSGGRRSYPVAADNHVD